MNNNNYQNFVHFWIAGYLEYKCFIGDVEKKNIINMVNIQRERLKQVYDLVTCPD